MHAFFPSREENTGAAVLVFPGGGYHHLTYDLGGYQIAKWFNTIGVTAFVVNYRLPNSPDVQNRQNVPLQDAQRAMRIVRAHAAEWDLDLARIGVLGTSAGGHLASTLATHREDVSSIGDSLKTLSFRPDFMILISPVISMGEYTHHGSRENLLGKNPSEKQITNFSNELQVTDHTPPAFLIHAANDNAVSPQNSLLFYQAMLKHDKRSTLHIFPKGEHNISVAGNPGSTRLWTDLCEEWLRELNFIE